MPRGRYSLHDPHDQTPLGEEHFQCAVGPTGWRYFSQTTGPAGDHTGSTDLTLDALGRPVRLQLTAADWQIRGAALDGLTWVRSGPAGTDATEGNARAHTFAGSSPAFLIALARLLRPTAEVGSTRARVVTFAPPVLAPRTHDCSLALVESTAHPTDSAPLRVDTYQLTDLETGEHHPVHMAGDVVLSAPGIELEDLETPPSTFPAL